MNFNQYTIRSQEVLQKASEIASDFGQQSVETGHILKAILVTDENVANFMTATDNITNKEKKSATVMPIAAPPPKTRK